VNDAGRPLVFHALVVVGIAIVGAVLVFLRQLRKDVALEDAERVLRDEIDRCEKEPRR
jgi:hypothetical protein